MENRVLAKNWEKILGKKPIKGSSNIAKARWIFELLGWEKKWKKTNQSR